MKPVCRVLIVAAVVLFGSYPDPSPAAFTASQATRLEAGVPFRAVLGIREQRDFVVDVSPAAFIRIVLDEPTGGLGLDVLTPSGSKTSLIHRALTLFSDTGGAYTLRLRRPVGAQVAEMRYTVTVEVSAPASEAQRRRARADQVILELRPLLQQRDEAPLLDALERLKDAFALVRGDADGEVSVLTWTALVHEYLGGADRAIALHQEIVGRHRAAGDRLREAEALDSLSFVAGSLGEPETSLQSAHEAVAISRSVGDVARLNYTLIGLGHALARANDPLNAALAFEEAHAVFERPVEPDDVLGFAGEQRNLAGQPAEAARDFQLAAALARRMGTAGAPHPDVLRWEAQTARAIADSGDRETARAMLRSAVAAGTDPAGVSYLNAVQLGMAYAAVGERDLALAYLSRALGVPPGKVPRPRDLGAFGPAFRRLREFELAVAADEETLAFVRSQHERRREARVLARLAESERDLGRLPSAREHIEQSLEIFESLRDKLTSVESRVAYASFLQKQYGVHIDVLMRLHAASPDEGWDAAALAVSERARARGLLDLLGEAGVDIRKGADRALLEAERSARNALDAATRRHDALLRRQSASKARDALDLEITRRAEELERIRGRLRASSPHYTALVHPSPLTLRQIQEHVLDVDTTLLEFVLGDDRSFLWVVGRDEHASYVLPPRRDIEDLARRVYEYLAAPDRAPGETASSRADRLRRSRAAFDRDARQLSVMLLGPAASALRARRLLVVASGALQFLPFGALPAPSVNAAAPTEPLGLRREVVYAPSASVIAVLRRETSGRPPARGKLAVVADPVFDSADSRVQAARPRPGPEAADRTGNGDRFTSPVGLPRLLLSRREADAIASALAPRDVMKALDFAATRELVLGPRLADFGVVHFATHGIIDTEHPALSRLVLSLVDRRGAPREGYVRLQDVYDLTWRADLVVLSACQTALGKEVKGEGLVGFTRGFMYAGAPRVVASLWKVDDAATASLMARFYRRMLVDRLRPSAALHAAMGEMRRDPRWRDPRHWAAFTLQGDWR